MAGRRGFLTTAEIVEITGGSLLRGRSGDEFTGVCTDSRNILPGCLFIPLSGDRYDGHDFVDEALRKGAAGSLIGTGRRPPDDGDADAVMISVPDTLNALGDIAHFWRKRFTVPVIAITGSSGKTSTKEMAAAVASSAFHVHKTPGNYNNLIGVPLTLLQMNEQQELVILEMGTNRRGEIARLTDIAEPDIGVITNIGPAHLEGLGTIDVVRDEKADLFLHMRGRGRAVLNADDPATPLIAEILDIPQVTFGVGHEAFLRAVDIKAVAVDSMRFTIRMGKAERNVTMNALGVHQVSNALAAAAAAWCAGLPLDDICEGLARYRPVQGRMTVRSLKNGAFLIDDSYNANPASVREALRALRERKGAGRLVVILGDMLELGDRAPEMHEEIGRYLASTGVDRVYLRGDFTGSVTAGALRGGMKQEGISPAGDPAVVARDLARYVTAGDWILIKGSRMLRMEEFVDALLKTIGPAELNR
ncbi:MAG: UDP-N-acetylmuramoyl-tripeptide--D-alanyl-D-alanine ligase [Deltaproteobacteria bacterium]|nr:UDP-N-acetylmuramoyl-tripeptide--D-alanyl-D-alanine ligase [Deltaproteobacteria bacterium]